MGKFGIRKIKAREILDSRGIPTVEVDLYAGGIKARASVPSGSSTGVHEAHELRDGGKRYDGKGVLKAVGNVNGVIATTLDGQDVREQEDIDAELIELDGKEDKSNLGANALLAVSLAACRAAAMVEGKPLFKRISFLAGNDKAVLPVPMVLVMEGGKHASHSSDIQEFMIMPHRAKTFNEALRIGTEIDHEIGDILKRMGKPTNVGMEGAFGPSMGNTEAVFGVIMEGIEKAGYKPKKDIVMATDSAASVFYKDGAYHLDGKKYGMEDLVEWYADLAKRYPIFSLEDPFAEDDWHGFIALTERIGKNVTVIGDDLLVTNLKRIGKALKMNACNGLLLKPNQIGTVTETIGAAKLAMEKGWKVVVSHRSGETTDSFIADLAVGLGCGFIKTGAPCRSERLAKYNRLLRIEEELQGG